MAFLECSRCLGGQVFNQADGERRCIHCGRCPEPLSLREKLDRWAMVQEAEMSKTSGLTARQSAMEWGASSLNNGISPKRVQRKTGLSDSDMGRVKRMAEVLRRNVFF